VPVETKVHFQGRATTTDATIEMAVSRGNTYPVGGRWVTASSTGTTTSVRVR
jgi:hypothetical protein